MCSDHSLTSENLPLDFLGFCLSFKRRLNSSNLNNESETSGSNQSSNFSFFFNCETKRTPNVNTTPFIRFILTFHAKYKVITLYFALQVAYKLLKPYNQLQLSEFGLVVPGVCFTST